MVAVLACQACWWSVSKLAYDISARQPGLPNSRSVLGSFREEAERDEGGAQDHDCAREKNRAQACRTGNEPQRHVEKGGVGPHCETATLWRRAAYSLDTEPGVHQRIANPREHRSDSRPYFGWPPPDDCETSCFDEYGNERDSRAAQPVRQFPEQYARHDQGCGEGAEWQPDRKPAAVGKEERAEGEDRAKTDAAEGRPKPWDRSEPLASRLSFMGNSVLRPPGTRSSVFFEFSILPALKVMDHAPKLGAAAAGEQVARDAETHAWE
jgi:hypothetical protein